METLKVSEIFDSLQGEGVSVGQASTFLRLAGCNLRCDWCDTRYSWDWTAYSYADNVSVQSIEEVALRVNGAARLVITGGEPLLQQRGLEALLAQVPTAQHVEVETNGTRSPEPALVQRVNQWNVSPKLANSGEPESRRLNDETLRKLRDTGKAYLKLVVNSDADEAEACELVTKLEWPKTRVLLMPQARTGEEMVLALPGAARTALKLGYGISPRLHLLIWNGERGR